MEQWGTLPPQERNQIIQQLTEGLSPSDRAIIENYLRNLAKAKSK